MGYRVINGQVYPVEPIGDFQQKEKVGKSKANVNFKDIFHQEINKQESFTMSKHALDRLSSRNIKFNENDMKAINQGINKAEEKGAKNSVIFYKDVAFVTSITNRTVITAVDKDSAKDNVFTNIDSVVLI